MSTRAIDALAAAGVHFTVHTYEPAGDDDTTYGEAVAATLGVAPARVFKTLVAEVDGDPVVAIVPVAGRLSTKALARAVHGKRAGMVGPADAERLTGYVTGAISPFGQRRLLPVVVDESATGFETVYVSGAKRGLQIELSPDDLVSLTGAVVAPIADG